ncbi:MAG: LysR family transcriptional regulator [Pseudomonadota bacterium]
MELRQLRYFVRIVELGSIGRAAIDLNVVQSALSQQISRLEGELSTRLLQRTSKGTTPTEAGLSFFREAQLSLRHADQAARAARQSRLSGTVSVGLAPSTAAILGVHLMKTMQERYPDVRLHLVVTLSGFLARMLTVRQLDLAILFDAKPVRRLATLPLLEEKLFLVESARLSGKPPPSGTAGAAGMTLAQLGDIPLALPTGMHGLRKTLDTAFAQAGVTPRIAMEVDSLSMVMAAVDAGLAASIQPWTAICRYSDATSRFRMTEITDPGALRLASLCSLSDDELSPAALAVRVTLSDMVQALVNSSEWVGARLL